MELIKTINIVNKDGEKSKKEIYKNEDGTFTIKYFEYYSSCNKWSLLFSEKSSFEDFDLEESYNQMLDLMYN